MPALAMHAGATRPPQWEAAAVAGDLVTEMVEEALWAVPQEVRIRASTHKKVEAVTRNADSLPHAMAVVRALHGRQDLNRRQLRQLACSFYRLPFYRYSEWPKEEQQYLRQVLAPKGLLRHRLQELFVQGVHTKPPFVQQLLRTRATNKLGNREPVGSPYECGMERAYRQMQNMRAQRLRPPLRWVEDPRQWWPAHRDQAKAPKGTVPGERIPEYLEWYAEQLDEPRNFMTLYDLEAMVLMLPEKPSLILYTPRGGRMTAMTFGPPPKRGVAPYELVWSGDDSVQFAPIVLSADLKRATALAKQFVPQYGCRDLTGPDRFRSGMLRSHVGHAETALRDAGFEPTAERLGMELGVTAEVAAAMRTQIECEDFRDYDLDHECRQLAGVRQRKRERTAHAAVSVKLRCMVSGRRTELRHRVAHRSGRDEAALDSPFARTGRTMLEFRKQMDELGERLQRPPLVHEVATEIREDIKTARALFLAFLEEVPYTGFEFL